MAYNYHKAVLADLETMIRENLNYILEDFEAKNLEEIDKNDLEEYIKDEAWIDDSVTGNGSGSYFFDECKSAEALVDNDKVIAEALGEFGDESKIGKNLSIDYLDVTVRCYELSNCLDEAIENVIESPDKQVAEDEVIEPIEYKPPYYEDEVRKELENFISENINDILKENDINSVEDYKNNQSAIEEFILDKVRYEEIDLPFPEDRDILLDIETAFDVDFICNYDLTLKDYFSNADVDYLIRCNYSKEVASEQISNALELTYEEIIQPAIEQIEAEQDINLD